MKTIILLETSKALESANSPGYLPGALIALFILLYLLYSLIKPEKF